MNKIIITSIANEATRPQRTLVSIFSFLSIIIINLYQMELVEEGGTACRDGRSRRNPRDTFCNAEKLRKCSVRSAQIYAIYRE